MAKSKEVGDSNFDDYEKDSLTKPRDLAWENWAKFEEVGDKVQGYIVDVFYRKAEGEFKEQRGITLKQPNGELINVAIKRIPFVLHKTNDLRLGDPLTIVFEKSLQPRQKGYKGAKVFAYYGKNLDSTIGQKTVRELDKEDMEMQGNAPEEEPEEDGEQQSLEKF
jgi:hypothetical protein